MECRRISPAKWYSTTPFGFIIWEEINLKSFGKRLPETHPAADSTLARERIVKLRLKRNSLEARIEQRTLEAQGLERPRLWMCRKRRILETPARIF